jgi:hypothetical protein
MSRRPREAQRSEQFWPSNHVVQYHLTIVRTDAKRKPRLLINKNAHSSGSRKRTTVALIEQVPCAGPVSDVVRLSLRPTLPPFRGIKEIPRPRCDGRARFSPAHASAPDRACSVLRARHLIGFRRRSRRRRTAFSLRSAYTVRCAPMDWLSAFGERLRCLDEFEAMTCKVQTALVCFP